MYAATTPSSSSAFETSIEVIFAWAKGLRTRPTQSIPGSAMLSTYVPCPVMSSGSSLRSWLVPTNPLASCSVVAIPSP